MGVARGDFRMRRCFMAGVEAVEAESRHSFPRHTHEQFGIGLIERGAQKSASGRGPVEAGAGNMITVNPGEVHDGIPIGDAGRRWSMLYLDPGLAAHALLDISEGRAGDFTFALPVLAEQPPIRLFRRLFLAMTEEALGSLARDEALLMLLDQAQGEPVTRQPLAPPISIARDMIDSDPPAPVTLDTLSRACGLSRFQLVRGFARVLGLTPHAYLMQQRVHLARRLVADGVPLAETAAASGFADQSHMNRHFLRAYGISPGAYAAALA